MHPNLQGSCRRHHHGALDTVRKPKKAQFPFWDKKTHLSRSEPLWATHVRLPELYLDRVKYPTRLWLRNGSAHRLSGSEPSRWQHYSVNSEFSTVLAVFGLVLTGKPATHAGWVDTGAGAGQAELPMGYRRQSLTMYHHSMINSGSRPENSTQKTTRHMKYYGPETTYRISLNSI